MSLDKLVPVAITFAILAAASGNLPKIIHELRLAQAHLIQDSKASRWGTPWIVPEYRRPNLNK